MTADGWPLTIVHTEYGLCITTLPFADWREVQDAFSGYKSSVCPYKIDALIEYLAIEYPCAQPFTEASTRGLAKAQATHASLWAHQLTEQERTKVPEPHVWSFYKQGARSV